MDDSRTLIDNVARQVTVVRHEQKEHAANLQHLGTAVHELGGVVNKLQEAMDKLISLQMTAVAAAAPPTMRWGSLSTDPPPASAFGHHPSVGGMGISSSNWQHPTVVAPPVVAPPPAPGSVPRVSTADIFEALFAETTLTKKSSSSKTKPADVIGMTTRGGKQAGGKNGGGSKKTK